MKAATGKMNIAALQSTPPSFKACISVFAYSYMLLSDAVDTLSNISKSIYRPIFKLSLLTLQFNPERSTSRK